MKNSEQPAFPPTKELCEASKIETYPYGLTKREYFAAMAMQGLLSDSKVVKVSSTDDLVNSAIELADELLKQLEK